MKSGPSRSRLSPEPQLPAETRNLGQPPDPAGEQGGQESSLLFVGATVHTCHAFPGRTRTLLHLSNPLTGKSFRCWSAAPWHHLAGAMASFEGPDGRQYGLILSWSTVELDHWGDFADIHGKDAPEMPEFAPADRSSLVLIPGETPPPDDLAPLTAIHDWCRNPAVQEKLRLAWEGRQRAEAEAEAARRADPPEKRNITLSTWRIGGAVITPSAER